MSSSAWYTHPETRVLYRVAQTQKGEHVYQIDNEKSAWLSKADFERELKHRGGSVPRYLGSTDPSNARPFLEDQNYGQERLEQSNFEVRPGTVAPIRRGSVYEPVHGIGAGHATQLSSLVRGFINLGLGNYLESADFIADNPNILRKSEIDTLIAEASTAERAGQSTRAQTCIHQALLLRECGKSGSSNIGHFFHNLAASDGRAKTAFVEAVQEEYATIKEQARSTTPQNKSIPSGNTQSQAPVVRNKDGRMFYTDNQGNILRPAGSRHDPDLYRSVSNPVERMPASNMGEETYIASTGTPGRERGAGLLHRSATSDSNRQLTAVVEDRTLEPSRPGGNGNITKKLDDRYRVIQKDTKKFFERGRVFAVLWDEPAGNGGGRGSKRGQTEPSDGVLIRNRFGEAVFSHIRRMVVVKERHGFCLCLAINTYQGQGVAKPGLSDEDRRAHSIIYMMGTRPWCTADEKQFLDKKAIEVEKTSEDQKLDRMSRLNYNKIYTVDHNLKVMGVGRVTRDSLLVLLGYWRNTLDDDD